MEIKEGYMPFMGYQTYYRIVGKTEEGKSPISRTADREHSEFVRTR